MSFQIPRGRGLDKIQFQSRRVPIDQIIAVQGQNPVATGIETAGNAIGQALTKRNQLQMEGRQLAQALQLAGVSQPQDTMTGLNPQTAINAVKANEDREVKLQLLKNEAKNQASAPDMKTIYQDLDSGKVSGVPLPGFTPVQMKTSEATKLLNTGYQKNIAPTTATRNTAETAATVIPHIQELRGLIHEAAQAGYIGPVSGRIYGDFLAGKVGSTGNIEADHLLGQLRSYDSLVKTALMKTHFGARGGQQMYEHFSNMLNTGKQSEAMLNGTLDTFDSFARGYAHAGGVDPNKNLQELPIPTATPFPVSNPNKDALRKKLGL